MKRIPSWPGVTNYSNKAEYQRADLVCYTSTSLATKQRTIHTQIAVFFSHFVMQGRLLSDVITC